MVYRDPRDTTTALDQIEDLAGEYWQRGDGTAQRVYDAVARELAEQIRNADYPAHATDGADYAADLIDPEVPR
jgi:hypothetical protein